MITKQQSDELISYIVGLRDADDLRSRYTTGATNMSLNQVSDNWMLKFTKLSQFIESITE